MGEKDIAQKTSDTIKHVREVFNLLSILTENHNLEDQFNEIHFDRKDGKVNMEAAWQKVMDQNYNEGFSKGEARGITIGEARAEKQYLAQLKAANVEIAALKFQLAQARK